MIVIVCLTGLCPFRLVSVQSAQNGSLGPVPPKGSFRIDEPTGAQIAQGYGWSNIISEKPLHDSLRKENLK